MIKVQELRSYTRHESVPAWELDSYYYIAKPELKNYEGTWYIVGQKHSPVSELSDVLWADAWNRCLSNGCIGGIPIVKNKYPVRVLGENRNGHECGQVYYLRHIININGVIYPEWWIYDHITEVKAELDAIKTEDLLQEI